MNTRSTNHGPNSSMDDPERTASSIGTGVQVFLVCCGILFFAGGLVLSFGNVGIADVVGGFGDDIDSDDDGTAVDDADTDQEPADDSSGDEEAADDGDDSEQSDDGDAEPLPPDVSTADASDIESSEATLNGNLDEIGSEDEVAVYFEWRSADDSSWRITDPEIRSSPDSFSQSIGDLESDTEYEFRAVVETADGDVIAGETRTFTTDEDTSVEVETDDASDVEADSAVLEGDLTELGDSDRATVYFEWREEGDDSWERTDTQRLDDTGSFSEEISDLESDTEYEFRAVVETNDGETDTGEALSFTTEEVEDDDDDNGDDDDDDDDDDSSFPF